MINAIKNKLSISPDLALHKHYVFWLPIVLFVGLALIVSFPTWCFCWPAPSDYESILKQQGFPIFIASLSIPITVAVNRFHASSQKAKANELTIQNLAFNHFFDHRKHFNDYLNNVRLPEPQRNFVELVDSNELYSIVFPLNKPNALNMNAPKDVVTEDLEERGKQLFEYINKFVLVHSKGNDPFIDISATEFINKIAEPFGMVLNSNIIEHIDFREACSVMHLSFTSILATINKIGQFSHTDFGGWVPVLALLPLIQSTKNTQKKDLFTFDQVLYYKLKEELKKPAK